ncbi:MAG: NAD(P)-dependent glycerol-3-phosphate dehydrogenase [Hyphomicrobiaceae bacterium]|nr:NAD(P)-dependent glycerol-3-phosphate dehydrogenase [Hyphomicrobiaceae bacterium]
MTIQSIGVVGAGAWGTALAQAVINSGRDALIWAHEPETVSDINRDRVNHTFLPEVQLDPKLKATSDIEEVAGQNALLMVAPAQHMRTIAGQLAGHLPDARPVIICSKGIEQSSGKMMSTVLSETLPGASLAVLSGPTFAAEVARGLPAALTLACENEDLGKLLAHAIGHATFRPYWSDDIIGAQIGGAIKNVLAIAAGIVMGRKLGSNAHAALTTRGYAEMVRFGAALGARAETLTGLSGLGDLILTCGSPQSRNMSLGIALGEGKTLDEVLGARRSVSEGVYTASAVVEIAQDKGLDLPICSAVHAIVSGSVGVDQAIEELLARPIRAEHEA